MAMLDTATSSPSSCPHKPIYEQTNLEELQLKELRFFFTSLNALEQSQAQFCIGVKLNSVDVSSQESLPEFMEQIQLIIEAGIDFVEISGGSYENFLMFQHTGPSVSFTVDDNLRQRESFFLYFAQSLRQQVP